MGRASGATALLAVAGLWTLCCVFVFGRFLGGEQPLDPRFHRARQDSASEDSARHLGSSGRLHPSNTESHGAVARHELDAFTGHGDFAENRHGGGVAETASPKRESRRVPPFGDERVSDANGASSMRIFAGHAAFDAATRSSDARSERSSGRETREDVEMSKNANANARALERTIASRDDAVGMESAPAFEAGEIDDARLTTDYADGADDAADPTVLREQDVSASLAAVARRVAEREARQETETLEQQVARLKDEALGRRGGALG